jgi:shikimate dehydrogenase
MNSAEQTIAGSTRVYGIIGWPVSHSLSPVMHNAAMRFAGIDGIYVPFAVEPAYLSQAVQGMRALRVSGFNVTIPHKTAIMPLLDKLAPTAVLVGAVNTVVNQGGCLIGHNTDGDGLVFSLQQDFGCSIANQRVVLVGAGGAAKGALAALCRFGVKSVLVVNRTVDSAVALVESFSDSFPTVVLRSSGFDGGLDRLLPETDLLINATPLGMVGEKNERLSLALLPDHARVYDMVYSPPLTPLLAAAQDRGLSIANGLGMLIAQGELAFLLWHGKSAGVGVMREALVSACPMPSSA